MGYNERDAIRGDDSWKSFHEVMCLAKEKDVDMVLLAGDLFHENKPSRKSMYQVMRSLRMNCYGEKPCELEMLSDPSEVFQGYDALEEGMTEIYGIDQANQKNSAFGHANYEDPDINVAIPVFSIHGNHDDPSGVCPFTAKIVCGYAFTRGLLIVGRPFSSFGFAPDFGTSELLWTDPRV